MIFFYLKNLKIINNNGKITKLKSDCNTDISYKIRLQKT